MLAVRLFGTFAIQCDSQPVTISSRIAQSLFAYLILTAGTLHRREKLAGMFWPDVAEEKARAYLRHELWRIRKTLSSISTFDYLMADDINISFNENAEYWLDVKVLEKLSDTASASELMNVLSEYRGELLPGFYDEWILQEREHLQAVYEKRMACLLELLESAKRWQELLDWAERWISHGQGPEAAYRYMMIAYDALGDRAKVTSTYQRCVEALRELDLEPSEETRAVAFKRTSKINIPIPLTSFIGREKELTEVATLLSKCRLVTLTGSGGVGKTRLAIQVVTEVMNKFPDGIWFLDLAPLNDPALVPNSLADVLGLRESENSNLSITEVLINYLRSRTALILFDNCEHLIESSAQLVNLLLTSCENLSILATSREALRVAGEISYRVPSLEIPKSDFVWAVEELATLESVKLFTDRATATSRGFMINSENGFAIAQICQRLDGIPLAIELAAARVNMLTVDQILKRLDDRFSFLGQGVRTALPRHQTLQATIEWSYDLLSEQERLLFRRLAVFVGGWTLEAAEEVCSGHGIDSNNVLDLLSQLVNKSLVLVETAEGATRYPTGGSLRYRRLETISQFAREKLAENGEREQLCAQHLNYFLKLAERAEPELYGAGQVAWMQKLEDEHENIRAALEWSLRGNVNAGQTLAGSLWWSWYLNGHLREGFERLEEMLAATPGFESSIRAKLLSGAGWFADNVEVSKEFSKKSVALFRKLGDEAGIAFPLATLGRLALAQSHIDLATQLFNESLELFKRAGNKWGVNHVLGSLGMIAKMQGNFGQALKYYEECLVITNEIGNKDSTGLVLASMGRVAELQGDHKRAMELYEEALHVERLVKSKPATAWILEGMGRTSILSGDYESGRLLLEEALEINRRTEDQSGIARSLRYFGLSARLQGDYPKARYFLYESLQLSHRLGITRWVAKCFVYIGELLLAQGSPEKFVLMLGMAEGTLPGIQRSSIPFLRTETEKFIETARAALGDEAYTAAWEAGKQMSLDEAVAYAVKELE